MCLSFIQGRESNHCWRCLNHIRYKKFRIVNEKIIHRLDKASVTFPVFSESLLRFVFCLERLINSSPSKGDSKMPLVIISVGVCPRNSSMKLKELDRFMTYLGSNLQMTEPLSSMLWEFMASIFHVVKFITSYQSSDRVFQTFLYVHFSNLVICDVQIIKRWRKMDYFNFWQKDLYFCI